MQVVHERIVLHSTKRLWVKNGIFQCHHSLHIPLATDTNPSPETVQCLYVSYCVIDA